MPLTAAQLSDVAAAAMDAHIKRPQVLAQNRIARPMWEAFDRKAKTFPSGKSDVEATIADGTGSIPMQGYTADESVTFVNPTGLMKAKYPWKETFLGLTVTGTELKADGITLIDSEGGAQRTQEKDGAERQRLAHLLKYKMDNLEDSRDKGFDDLLHSDGAATPRLPGGVMAVVKDDPAAGTTGGVNRTTNTWWRNRARTAAALAAGTGLGPIVSDPSNGGELIQTLQGEFRQMRARAGGRDKLEAFCGSDFLDAYEREIRANGGYSETGFRSGNVDGAMRQVSHGGIILTWDPSMDALGQNKRAYFLDLNAIYLDWMVGERRKKANPVRPADKFIFMTGYSDTFAFVAERVNSSGVFDIA